MGFCWFLLYLPKFFHPGGAVNPEEWARLKDERARLTDDQARVAEERGRLKEERRLQHRLEVSEAQRKAVGQTRKEKQINK